MSLIQPHRRGFLKSLGLLIAAPAIVRASSIMPVKAYREKGWSGFDTGILKGDFTLVFLVEGSDESGNWREEKIAVANIAVANFVKHRPFNFVDSV
jgi:hypothetical protein